MDNNQPAPVLGADSVCLKNQPIKPWQIYMLRGSQWVGVGACGSRALAETHIASLRKMMRKNKFQLRWEGAANTASI